MSVTNTFTANGNVGPSGGIRLASMTLAAGAAVGTASITDGTRTVTISATANNSFEWIAGDENNGAEFFGQAVLTVTGTPTAVTIETL